jgi:arylsulfatase A-like enzyme
MRLLTSLSLALLLGCTSEPGGDEAANPDTLLAETPGPRTVVLISLGSTRADALSCYMDTAHWNAYIERQLRDSGAVGRQLQSYLRRLPEPQTPNLCGLTEQGIRFQWALSHASSSLSSQVSIFAGMEPHRHRVVRRGYTVPSDVALLPARYHEAGWDTIAVVGSSELSASSGLDRGFRRYVEPDSAQEGSPGLVSGPEINRRVQTELAATAQPDGDLFLFVHYADLRQPWLDPLQSESPVFEELRGLVQGTDYDYSGTNHGSAESLSLIRQLRRDGGLSFSESVQARGLYLSQAAWVDRQVGLLLEDLESRGRLENALIVVVGDHGEALDDSADFPYAHGAEVDLHSIHVPLLVSGRGSMSLERTDVKHTSPVRLMDISSTLASASGLGEVHGDGRDLGPAWQEGGVLGELPHLAEATGPASQEVVGMWNNLSMAQAVVQDGLVLQKRPVMVGQQSGIAVQLYALAAGQPMVSKTDPDGRRSQLAYDMTERLMGTLKLWNDSAPAHRSQE